MNTPIETVFSRANDITPLNEYPRPQLKRSNWTNLNGMWEYAVTVSDENPPLEYTGKITVPFAIETSASGVMKNFNPGDCLHYRRFFEISKNDNKRVILHFEAVDWKCDVYLNGIKIGSHTGGYIPFSFDITDFSVNGENELKVSVTDPTDTHWQQRGKQKLNPSGIWYTPTSGIWQTVWLEEVPEEYIDSLTVTPSKELDSVEITVNSASSADCSIRILQNKETIMERSIPSNSPFVIPVENPQLWTPESPFLYDMEITLGEDSVKSYFGMRTISLSKGPDDRDIFMLNNTPVFMNGPLDQGYWPESGMTQPSDEAIIFDLQAMKDLGMNTIRKHIKIESRRWYYHADRLGLMVIQDMPNGGREFANYLRTVLAIAFDMTRSDSDKTAYKASMRDNKESTKLFENELEEMLVHLHNHPSIVIWCPFNESWGQYDAERIYKKVKSMDPSRLVDHASGWFDQGCGDFKSVHTYKIKLKDPSKNDKRAYLISEYGGYNLIDRDHLWRSDDTSGYKYFKSQDELTEAYCSLIEKQVIPLVEKGLCGVIYTQLSDVEIETNGFYTYDRKVLKMNADKVSLSHEKLMKTFADTYGK